MLDLVNKTPAELQALIAEAQQQLVEKHKAMRKEVIAQIKDLAASIGATVEVNFEQPEEKSGGRKVPVRPERLRRNIKTHPIRKRRGPGEVSRQNGCRS